MKFATILIFLAMLLGCGTPGMPLPPSLELPQPVQDLRASRKGDIVALAWTVPEQTTDHTAVRIRDLGATRICRSLKVAMTECADKAGEVDTARLVSVAQAAAEAKAKSAPGGKEKSPPSKPVTVLATAKDTLPPQLESQNPTGFATYAVEVLNTRGRSAGLSNQVQVPLAPTLPPPSDLAAVVTADGIELTFSGALQQLEELQAQALRHSYRIYREEQGTATPVMVGEVHLTNFPQARLLDRSFQWEKTYQYWVTAVTMVVPHNQRSTEGNNQSAIEVEGDNSAPVTVYANDVFPPAVPSGLQAVFSSVGQQPFVDLTWAPNTDPDLDGYNVYRREGNGPWIRLNSVLLPTPAFRDSNVAAGRTYSYAVTAVDARGNESPRSPESSETVPHAD